MFELTSAAWVLAALGALLDAGLADQLTEPRTIDELAARCPALSTRRIAKVLAVAATYGVVIADGPRYRLADGVKPVLCGPMRATVTGDIRTHLMQAVAFLDSASASAASTTWEHTDPRVLQSQGEASSVIPAMVKMMLAPMLGDLASRLERPGAKLLDVGTGVGALAISACRAFPQLAVVGIDPFGVPLELARANVTRAGLAERIELRQQRAEELRDEGAFACAWLPAFFIAADQLPAAIARVAAALEPGGWVLMGASGGGDAKQRAINELVVDVWGGPALTTAAAEMMLREAGLREVRTLPGPPWAPQMLAAMRA